MTKAYRKQTTRQPRANRATRLLAWFGVPLAVLLLAIVVVPWGQPGLLPHDPDIMLISVDTLRADHLECYGYKRIRTPAINRLASEGVLFTATVSAVPITLPSHASMLSGLIPPRHGARLNTGNRVPDDVTTLAETLQGYGYQTGAFVAALPMADVGGLAQGFEVYDQEFSTQKLPGFAATRQERYAEDVLAVARRWLATTDPARPVFAFVHLYDPHAPYEKPLPGTTTGSYDGEIVYVDRSLGSFLPALRGQPRWKDLLTIFTSDHGEALGEHGEQTHTLFVYESTLHVPLIVHWPGVLAPRRIESPVALIDITPTILELAGLPGLTDIDGRSLVSLIRGDEPPPTDRVLYFESLLPSLSYGWASLRGVRIGGLKYISAPRPELYDLRADPHELNNLIDSRPDDARHLAARLASIDNGRRATIAIDRKTLAGLESLGYISAPPVEGDDESPPPDPKDRVEVFERYQSALMASARGDHNEAYAAMADVAPYFEQSPAFHYRRGNTAARLELWDEAVDHYERSLKLDPQAEDAHLNLGVAYLKLGSPERSLEQFEALLGINPDHPGALLYAGQLKSRHGGNREEVIAHWTRFLEIAPDHPQADKVRRSLADYEQ